MAVNQPVSSSAADVPWSTPVGPASPVVSPAPFTREVAETPDPVYSPGSPGAQGDDVSASVAGSVAAAEARYTSHQADTFGIGSTIGTVISLPDTVSDWSKHTGGSDATSYDPAG